MSISYCTGTLATKWNDKYSRNNNNSDKPIFATIYFWMACPFPIVCFRRRSSRCRGGGRMLDVYNFLHATTIILSLLYFGSNQSSSSSSTTAIGGTQEKISNSQTSFYYESYACQLQFKCSCCNVSSQQFQRRIRGYVGGA
jgi:hypothetical protein